MKWPQFKELPRVLLVLLVLWSLTQEVAGLKPFTVATIFKIKFAKFSGTLRERLHYLLFSLSFWESFGEIIGCGCYPFDWEILHVPLLSDNRLGLKP